MIENKEIYYSAEGQVNLVVTSFEKELLRLLTKILQSLEEIDKSITRQSL